MPDDKNNLYLFEAIELRAEYDARIASIEPLLPEHRGGEEHRLYMQVRENERPVEGLDLEGLREELESLRTRRRKLNTAIQRANYESTVNVGGGDQSLAEALELRKETNKEIAELVKQLKDSAYAKVIYKEERDIVEKPKQDFTGVAKKLEQKRLLFRQLNRALRRANYEVTVDFKDE